jgi:anti-sigma-K factor RskA
MAHERDMLDLAPLYALGTLDARDAERFKRHLAEGCDRCQAALLEANGVASDLALLLPAERPSARAREAMLARVRADARARSGEPGEAPRGVVREMRPATPRLGLRRAAVAIGYAAAAAVLIALGMRVTDLERRLDSESTLRTAAVEELQRTRTELEGQVADARAELDRTRSSLETQVAQAEAALGAITAPGTRPVALAGQGERKQARATAYLDAAAGRLMLFVQDLPPPAPGKTYQLWVIVEGKPVSLGIFDVGKEGRARLGAEKLPELRGPITIAVTEEPAGGVPQPTGPMVLAGS